MVNDLLFHYFHSILPKMISKYYMLIRHLSGGAGSICPRLENTTLRMSIYPGTCLPPGTLCCLSCCFHIAFQPSVTELPARLQGCCQQPDPPGALCLLCAPVHEYFFIRYFLHQLPKEREPSEKLMGLQNQPHGHFHDIKKPDRKD